MRPLCQFVMLSLLAAAAVAADPAFIPAQMQAIPAGHLQTELAALPAAARARALDQLGSKRVPLADIASIHASGAGSLYYACPRLAATAAVAAIAPAASGQPQRAPVPIANPPIYHSKAGAARVCFLDFNGHLVSGTQWNTDEVVAAWNAKAFNTDADATTFSDAEQLAIYRIWQRVAEDYAPFDIDVTTEQPAVFTNQVGRVLITSKTDAGGLVMPHNTAGGVAYLDVFGQAGYVSTMSPAFVYYDNMGNQEDYIAEAASHEFGHNLGLSHDGRTTPSEEYYQGHSGGGVPSWGPIMGTGYDCDVSQWSKGEYTNASNTEDDLAIIAAKLTYRADEAGGTTGTATTITLTSTGAIPASATGIITTSADVDVYRISCSGGAMTATVTPFRCAVDTWGGNLDASIELLNGAGAVLAQSTPLATTSATVSYTLPGVGVYYIRITPVGVGTPTAPTPTGYTVYGSGGQYTLTGNFPVNAPVISSATFTPNPTAGFTSTAAVVATDDGGEPALTYTWSVRSMPAGATTVAFSPNGTNAAKNAVATFDCAGTYVLRVTVANGNAASSTSDVTVVVQQTVTTTTASVPYGSNIEIGTLRTFAASATDQFGDAMAPQPSFTWTVTPASGTIVAATGVFTATGAVGGPYVATANASGVSGTVAFSVTDNAPTIASMGVTPNPVTGTSASATVSASDDGMESGLTYTWDITVPGATAPSFAPNGTNAAKTTTVTFVKAGTYTVRVTARDAQSRTAVLTTAVTVSQTVSTWVVTPASVSLAILSAQAFTAVPGDQFGDAMGASAPSGWTTNGGSITASGAFTAGTVTGLYSVTAVGNGVTGTVPVTVLPPSGAETGSGGAGCGTGGGISSLILVAGLGLAGVFSLRRRRRG